MKGKNNQTKGGPIYDDRKQGKSTKQVEMEYEKPHRQKTKNVDTYDPKREMGHYDNSKNIVEAKTKSSSHKRKI